jgi:outer membrane lipoprotein carrier protein
MFRLRNPVILALAAAMLCNLAALVDAVHADSADLNKVIRGIEQHYGGKSFRASFFQESILKAMQMTDTAEGYLIVKPPGKMRWEYTVPDTQSIVTDGRTMWIYRPTDRQVMVGKAPEFFGSGKGAGLLSNISQIRKGFNISLQPGRDEKYYHLKLVPRKATPDLTDIIMSVDKSSFRIDQVVTHNAYGDETRIALSNYQFDVHPKDEQFHFTIPKGVEVVQMEKF